MELTKRPCSTFMFQICITLIIPCHPGHDGHHYLPNLRIFNRVIHIILHPHATWQYQIDSDPICWRHQTCSISASYVKRIRQTRGFYTCLYRPDQRSTHMIWNLAHNHKTSTPTFATCKHAYNHN